MWLKITLQDHWAGRVVNQKRANCRETVAHRSSASIWWNINLLPEPKKWWMMGRKSIKWLEPTVVLGQRWGMAGFLN